MLVGVEEYMKRWFYFVCFSRTFVIGFEFFFSWDIFSHIRAAFSQFSSRILLLVGGKEVLEGGDIASSLVVDGALVFTLGEELDGGESTDSVLLSEIAVLVAVELGNNDIILDLAGELFPSGDHTLAMTAPRGVEFDEDVLIGSLDDLIEVIRSKSDNLTSEGKGDEEAGEGDDLGDHCCGSVRIPFFFFFKPTGEKEKKDEPLLGGKLLL